MKKATTKRERKYGVVKNQEKVGKKIKKEPTQVMVDYAVIMKFKSKQDADEYINKMKKDASSKGQAEPSYIFL